MAATESTMTLPLLQPVVNIDHFQRLDEFIFGEWSERPRQADAYNPSTGNGPDSPGTGLSNSRNRAALGKRRLPIAGLLVHFSDRLRFRRPWYLLAFPAIGAAVATVLAFSLVTHNDF
jgi:hypothetical protein